MTVRNRTTMKIGFALIAENTFVNQIVALEREFHDKAGFSDILGTVNNLPHTTLFQGEMRVNIDYREIAEHIASEYLKLSKTRTLRFTHVKYVPHGWYFLLCRKSKVLSALHYQVLSKVEPYIVLPKERFEGTKDLPKAQREAIRNYNYRYAGEAFYPHVTIGRSAVKSDTVLNEMNLALNQIELSPRVERVTVYKMGINGVHETTLFEVKIV